MNETLITSLWPLGFLLPLWFALIKVGALLTTLNKRRLGRKRLAVIDAIGTIRIPLFMISVVQYTRHLINLHIDKDQNYFVIFLDKHVYFFVSLLLLTSTIITFVSTYKTDLINSYNREESLFKDLSRNNEKTQVDALSKVLNSAWLVIALIVLLDHFGVPATSILAFGGMGSLVIGFAAKDILSDVISGILLYFDNQFKIGEWIKIDQPKIEGTVESIGWRVSQIKTFDNRPIYVPNKFLGAAVIQNVSRRESMRFKEYLTLNISCTEKIPTICREIRNEIFLNHDGIDSTKSIVVNLANFEGEVANVYLSAYTKSADISGYYAIKQDIWIKIHQILRNNDTSVCAPKITKSFFQ